MKRDWEWGGPLGWGVVLAASAAVVTAAFLLLRPVLLPFALGATLAYVLAPLVAVLQRGGLSRSLAIAIVYIALAGAACGLVLWVLPDLVSELQRLAAQLPTYAGGVENWVGGVQGHYRRLPLPASLREGIDRGVVSLEVSAQRTVQGMLTGLGGIIRWVVALLLAPFLAYYFLVDLPRIRSAFLDAIPAGVRQPVLACLGDLDEVLSGFIRGELLISLVIATLSTIAAWFLHLRYALMLGLISGVFELVPYFGPFLGAIPALLVATSGGTRLVLATAVAFTVIQELEGTFLAPRIVGGSVGLHPLVALAALLAGEHWGGVGGAVLAVPLVAAIRIVGQHVVRALTRGRASRTIL